MNICFRLCGHPRKQGLTKNKGCISFNYNKSDLTTDTHQIESNQTLTRFIRAIDML